MCAPEVCSRMDYDYSKRGYLLPEGCKDLIDALKFRDQPVVKTGGLTLAKPMTVRELAAMLKQKPLRIVADLLELRVLAGIEQQLSLDLVAQVCCKYGYRIGKAA